MFQKRAIRIRIHSIDFYHRRKTNLEAGGGAESKPVKVLATFASNLLPKNVLDSKEPAKESKSNQQIFDYEALSKRQVIMKMVKISSEGASEKDIQCPVKDLHGGAFPRGAVFLTISIIEIPYDITMTEPKQIYRMDFPLTPEHVDPKSDDCSLRPYSAMETLRHSGLADWSDDEELKYSFTAPKPLVLFPACPANVFISFTLSEVNTMRVIQTFATRFLFQFKIYIFAPIDCGMAQGQSYQPKSSKGRDMADLATSGACSANDKCL